MDIEVADKDGNVVQTFTGITVGSTFTVVASVFGGASQFPSEIRFALYDLSSPRKSETAEPFTCDGDSCVRFHTSCSQPLSVGNSFGHLKIDDFATVLGHSRADCVQTTCTTTTTTTTTPCMPYVLNSTLSVMGVVVNRVYLDRNLNIPSPFASYFGL